jgi:predicted PurR-regulated permease PerM
MANERDRYAAARPRSVLTLLAGLATLAVADLFLAVPWPFYVGLASGFVSWEVTKWRMRRLRDRYEGSPRSL